MIWQSVRGLRAVRFLVPIFAVCLLIASCGSLLGPHDFEFFACTADIDCEENQGCSAAHRCVLGNAQRCDAAMKGRDCASGFCSTDTICCAEECSGPCQKCAGGVCSSLPVGSKGPCLADNVFCSAEGSCYCSNQAFLDLPDNTYRTGKHASSIAAADLNTDGKSDLVTTNTDDNTVSVLLNNGDGTFAAKVDYPTGISPSSVAAADLNNDGKPDLAVANLGEGAGIVSVLLHKDDGTFTAPLHYPTGYTPNSLAALDLNSDGKPDIAVANKTANTVSVLLNKGDGTFEYKVDYYTGESPSAVVALDLNVDGKPDLAVTYTGSNNIRVLLNNGDGTFLSQADYPSGQFAGSVVAVDLNGAVPGHAARGALRIHLAVVAVGALEGGMRPAGAWHAPNPCIDCSASGPVPIPM